MLALTPAPRSRSKGLRVGAAVAATVPLLLGGLGQASPAAANDVRTLITFENDSPYDTPMSSFTSPDRPDLEFCAVDLPNGHVYLYSYFATHYSNALIAMYDVGMKFGSPIDSLEMSFGGDSPTRVSANGEAVLTLFLGTEQVGEVRVAVNANEAVDQLVSTSGTAFNRATLQYVDATDEDAEYTAMVIDDLRVGQPVPGAENPATTCKNPPPTDPAPETPGCTIKGTSGADELVGTKGDDVICGFRGNDVLRGRGGDDLLLGRRGDDVVHGGSGRDSLRGGRGEDRGFGGRGADVGVNIEELFSARSGD